MVKIIAILSTFASCAVFAGAQTYTWEKDLDISYEDDEEVGPVEHGTLFINNSPEPLYQSPFSAWLYFNHYVIDDPDLTIGEGPWGTPDWTQPYATLYNEPILKTDEWPGGDIAGNHCLALDKEFEWEYGLEFLWLKENGQRTGGTSRHRETHKNAVVTIVQRPFGPSGGPGGGL